MRRAASPCRRVWAYSTMTMRVSGQTIGAVAHADTAKAVPMHSMRLTNCYSKWTATTAPNDGQRFPDTTERDSHDAARIAKRGTDGKARCRELQLGFRYAHGNGRSTWTQQQQHDAHTSCRFCSSHRWLGFTSSSGSLVRQPSFSSTRIVAQLYSYRA